MAQTVASRFAVLSIDDDDDYPKKNQQKKKTDKKQVNTNLKTDQNPKKKTKKDIGKTSNSSGTKSKLKPTHKGDGSAPSKKKNPTDDQWDQWKRKDSEFVDDNYEHDLHQAILLSKLDFEEKKDLYEVLKKEEQANQENKSQGKRQKKQQSKTQPMSLEQFNNLATETATPIPDNSVTGICPPAPQLHDTTFFERIDKDTKQTLEREHSLEIRKAREPFIEEAITVAQLQDALEKRTNQNKELKKEIVKLKEELHNVKTRNKKLCQILAQGEMKEKAEVLIEVDRLQMMRDELSSEVSNLHAQLEQERSKVHALTAENKNKSQNKKRTASETAQ